MASASPRIELRAEHRNFILVTGRDDTRPRKVKLDSVPQEFLLYCRGNYHLNVKTTQQVELVHSGEIEDWGDVGNDDQAPDNLFARCRSCSIASTP